MVIRDLGQVDYLPTTEAMKAFTRARGGDTPDELWVLEHPPVFTQGIAGKAQPKQNTRRVNANKRDKETKK